MIEKKENKMNLIRFNHGQNHFIWRVYSLKRMRFIGRHNDNFAFFYCEVHISQNVILFFVYDICFAEVFNFKNIFHNKTPLLNVGSVGRFDPSGVECSKESACDRSSNYNCREDDQSFNS